MPPICDFRNTFRPDPLSTPRRPGPPKWQNFVNMNRARVAIYSRHEYKYIYKVKPGLTSWGMVKYGYASSVDEMIQRMPYDLLYVENVSLPLDFTIMFHTIKIILSGKGK